MQLIIAQKHCSECSTIKDEVEKEILIGEIGKLMLDRLSIIEAKLKVKQYPEFDPADLEYFELFEKLELDCKYCLLNQGNLALVGASIEAFFNYKLEQQRSIEAETDAIINQEERGKVLLMSHATSKAKQQKKD